MATAKTSLTELVKKYFTQKGYRITENPTLEGFSGVTQTFDLQIEKGSEKRLVRIKDWDRTVGVNMIIKMDKSAEDVAIPKPIMISQQFSGHAKAYANRRGIILLTESDIKKSTSQ
ncbi:MAG: restriction endonuclease [Candidatus Bathyarchaeales archaeon]